MFILGWLYLSPHAWLFSVYLCSPGSACVCSVSRRSLADRGASVQEQRRGLRGQLAGGGVLRSSAAWPSPHHHLYRPQVVPLCAFFAPLVMTNKETLWLMCDGHTGMMYMTYIYIYIYIYLCILYVCSYTSVRAVILSSACFCLQRSAFWGSIMVVGIIEMHDILVRWKKICFNDFYCITD